MAFGLELHGVPTGCHGLAGHLIPPHGGNTLFANHNAAWDALPDDLKSRLRDAKGITLHGGDMPVTAHMAKKTGRPVVPCDSLYARAENPVCKPIARVHPETGRTALYVSPGYTLGIEGWPESQRKRC